MRWTIKDYIDGSYADQLLRHYSTDIAAAWEAVDRIRGGSSGYFQITTVDSGGFEACVDLVRMIRAQGKTAPHAICLAALKLMNA